MFNENDHPRDNNGKFAKKNGGGVNEPSEKAKSVEAAVKGFEGLSAEQTKQKILKDQKPAEKKGKTLAVPEGTDLRERILSDTNGKMSIDEIVNHPLIKMAQSEYETSLGRRNEQGIGAAETININTPEREQIRRKAADEINSRGSVSGKGEYNGEVKKGFRAEIVIGAPAGGKSSVIVDRVSQNTGSRVLDSDEVKALLPEFDGGNGAGLVHKESADIILNGMVMPDYYKGGTHAGDNIVIPIVGKNPRNAQMYLEKLKAAGYSVHLSFNDVTPLNSAKRATTRFIETGRFLSPEYIQGIGSKPQATYDTLKKAGGFDSYSRYDNNVAFGQPAKKIERLDGSGNKIDWEEWQ